MSDQTIAGMSRLNNDDLSFVLTPAEKSLLSDLAARVAEIAARPIESEKRDNWRALNGLRASRPLIFCDPENGWNEIVTPESLESTGELARRWEMYLRKEIFWAEEMRDDRVTESVFPVPFVSSESDWGLHETKIGGEEGGSYVWDSPVSDYAADLPKLRFPTVSVDYAQTTLLTELAEEVVGKSLRVIRRHPWWWTLGMTWTLVNLRGLNQMMLDMLDEPDQLHLIMAFLRDGTLARLDYLERDGLLTANNDGTYVGSGGFGWTDELPRKDFSGKVRPIDMWGFGESQETVGVSPAMFAEFVFPYQLPILSRFGLNCYGCCEPLDRRWSIIREIPRLRRVSVSAWADAPKMAEILRGDYVYSWKPRPADLAAPRFDEDSIRSYVRKTLEATRGCQVEIIMKDNHTIARDPRRVTRWVEIVREEIERLD